MNHLFLTLITVSLFVTSQFGFADQRDPRLNELFQQLQTTRIPQEGNRITNEIWEIWRLIDDETVDQFMRQGILAMGHGDFRMALNSFNYATQIAPDYAEAWNKRATLFYLVGEYERSIADVQKTLALEPRHFGALAGLGLIYEKTEQYQAAIHAFRDALKVNPHLSDAQHNIEVINKRLHGDAI